MLGLEVSGAERFEAGEEFADAPIVLDPGAVALGLLWGEPSGDRFAGDFAGPLPVGAVQAGSGRLGSAAWFAAVGVALLD